MKECPDLEALATFADGRLSGPEREQVIEHLADCEDCYELVAETLHLGEELGRAPAPEATDSGIEAGGSGSWLPLAAAAVGLIWFATGTRSGHPASGVELSRLPAGWSHHSFLADERGLNTDEIEGLIQVGVRHVDLWLAIRSERWEIARQVHDQLMEIARNTASPPLPERSYRELEEAIDQKSRNASTRALETADRLLSADIQAGEAALYFELGRWGETLRIACLLGDPSPLRASAFRKTTRKLRDAEGLEDPHRGRFYSISRALPAEGPAWEDREDLCGQLDELLLRSPGGSHPLSSTS